MSREWWKNKWKQAAIWDDAQTEKESIASVMEGLRPLKRSSPTMEAPSGLLDGGNPGRSQLVGPGVTPVPLLELSADNQKARIITITLMTFGPPPLEGIPGDPAIATVQFGVGGVQAEAEVDFLQHTVFTVPCAFLRVLARRRTHAASPASPLKLAAFASYGAWAGRAPQRTLREIDVVSGGPFPLAGGGAGQATFAVPAFAKYVQIGVFPTAGTDYTVDFQSSSGANLYSRKIGVPSALRYTGSLAETPLSNDCRRIRITNDGAAPMTNARLIFGLAL